MKDLLYNFDSVEVSYGDNALTSIVQIDERISDIAQSLEATQLNDFEKEQIAGRVDKLIFLNYKIQKELELQVDKLKDLKEAMAVLVKPHHD